MCLIETQQDQRGETLSHQPVAGASFGGGRIKLAPKFRTDLVAKLTASREGCDWYFPIVGHHILFQIAQMLIEELGPGIQSRRLQGQGDLQRTLLALTQAAGKL